LAAYPSNPPAVGRRPAAEHLLIHLRLAHHLAEKVHHLFGAREPAQLAVNDNPVKTAVYKHQQAVIQLGKHFHRSSSPIDRVVKPDHRIDGRWNLPPVNLQIFLASIYELRPSVMIVQYFLANIFTELILAILLLMLYQCVGFFATAS
jgi:hypothetical protein